MDDLLHSLYNTIKSSVVFHASIDLQLIARERRLAVPCVIFCLFHSTMVSDLTIYSPPPALFSTFLRVSEPTASDPVSTYCTITSFYTFYYRISSTLLSLASRPPATPKGVLPPPAA